jgi:hypothetical protein
MHGGLLNTIRLLYWKHSNLFQQLLLLKGLKVVTLTGGG